MSHYAPSAKPLLLSAAALLFCLLSPAAARAASVQTYVSVSGSDANTASSCNSPANPCRLISAALSVTTPGGVLTVLSSGGYGPFTVTQSVQVVAAPGVQAMTTPNNTSPAQAIIIDAPGKRVVLRGLYVQHYVVGNVARAGIRAKAFGSLHIENCVVDGFTDDGIEAIYSPASGAAPELYITDTVVRGSGGSGILIQSDSLTIPINAVLERVRAEAGGSTGGTAGIRIQNSVRAAVRGSVSSGNVIGFFARGEIDGVKAQLSIEDCVATRNAIGVTATVGVEGDAEVDVSGTTIMFNTTGVSASNSGAVFSRGDNTLRRNTTTNGAFTFTFTPD